jgi:hypothetical protein
MTKDVGLDTRGVWVYISRAGDSKMEIPAEYAPGAPKGKPGHDRGGC